MKPTPEQCRRLQALPYAMKNALTLCKVGWYIYADGSLSVIREWTRSADVSGYREAWWPCDSAAWLRAAVATGAEWAEVASSKPWVDACHIVPRGGEPQRAIKGATAPEAVLAYWESLISAKVTRCDLTDRTGPPYVYSAPAIPIDPEAETRVDAYAVRRETERVARRIGGGEE